MVAVAGLTLAFPRRPPPLPPDALGPSLVVSLAIFLSLRQY